MTITQTFISANPSFVEEHLPATVVSKNDSEKKNKRTKTKLLFQIKLLPDDKKE
jgi:hypothetical protein